MSEKIEPALTAEELARKAFDLGDSACSGVDFSVGHFRLSVGDCGGSQDMTHNLDKADAPKMIAAANDHLPDSDPRKITRAMVEFLRQETEPVGADKFTNRSEAEEVSRDRDTIRAIADALESYLPPFDG